MSGQRGGDQDRGGLAVWARGAVRRHVPTHEVSFQVLRGTAVEVNEFNRWPLFRAAEDLLERFRARNPEEEFQLGLVRVPVPAFPELSFREATANALVHRDYTLLGPVLVQWRDDRLRSAAPVGFLPASCSRTCSLRLPIPEARSWRTHSSGRGWWSGRAGGSI